jgi:hypothetical protein
MRTFTYYFDELSIMPRYAVYAVGEADVSYKIRPAEPDVGIFEHYATDISVDAIVVYGHGQNDSKLNIDADHWLYRHIEQALLDDGSLAYACIEDAAP